MLLSTRALVRHVLLPVLLTGATAMAQSPPPRARCEQPEHRQFDFWVGHWEVFLPDGTKAGDNVITPVAGGCALFESWTGAKGGSGNSLNSWVESRRQWQQHWVDADGVLSLRGGRVGAAMVMSDDQPHPVKPGVTVTQRITWTPAADGSVRQLWESSEDGGATWSVVFDGRYVRRR